MTPRGITIRDTTSRWGSCSREGNLSFSWRLVLAPPAGARRGGRPRAVPPAGVRSRARSSPSSPHASPTTRPGAAGSGRTRRSCTRPSTDGSRGAGGGHADRATARRKPRTGMDVCRSKFRRRRGTISMRSRVTGLPPHRAASPDRRGPMSPRSRAHPRRNPRPAHRPPPVRAPTAVAPPSPAVAGRASTPPVPTAPAPTPVPTPVAPTPPRAPRHHRLRARHAARRGQRRRRRRPPAHRRGPGTGDAPGHAPGPGRQGVALVIRGTGRPRLRPLRDRGRRGQRRRARDHRDARSTTASSSTRSTSLLRRRTRPPPVVATRRSTCASTRTGSRCRGDGNGRFRIQLSVADASGPLTITGSTAGWPGGAVRARLLDRHRRLRVVAVLTLRGERRPGDVSRDAGGPGRNRTATAEGEGFTDPWAHHLPNRPTMVEMRGLEPLTPAMRTRRSPS